jgi:hypothetical protein
VVGYDGGERAFVRFVKSFATRRLRLTIYWRRAGLVVRSWDCAFQIQHRSGMHTRDAWQ